MLTDGQFKPWRQELNTNGTELNVVSKYKHVSDIERYVRTLKERGRATYNSLPYTHFGLPMIIMVEMMCTNISWLNVFPVEDSVSSHIGSCQIITCHLPDYELHCRLQFSTCLQAHIKGDNSMVSRTTGALVLRPMSNAQTGYYLISLKTGRQIIGQSWTPPPTPTEVIKRVNTMSCKTKTLNKLTFQHSDMLKVGDNSSNNFITAVVQDNTDDDDGDYSDSDSTNNTGDADKSADITNPTNE